MLRITRISNLRFRLTNRLKARLAFTLALAGTLSAATDRAAIDAVLGPVTDGKQPGAAVLVRENGRTSAIGCYGVRDTHSLRRITPATNFRLASFTKQFTAMAIMLLVHDGKLRYDENLTEIFPEFADYGRAITIRHLLTHTSGLPDYEDLMGTQWNVEHQISDQEVLRLLEQQKTGKFAPGTSWAYSNSGYVVLGLVVAKVSGQPLGDFLHARIFAPLHMTHTLVYEKGRNTVSQRAYGYSKQNGQLVDSDQSATSGTQGDGGIYSNLRDLARWDDALRAFKLLSAAEMATAWTPVKLNDGSETHWPKEDSGDNAGAGKPVLYGFGWFLDPLDGRQRQWHTGSTSGFRTVIERFEQNGLTIIVLCNRTDLSPADLAEKVAEQLRAQ